MKKVILSAIFLISSSLAFAQSGSAELRSFVPAGSTSSNIARTLGQLFNDHAPDDYTTNVAEGVEQAYLVDTYDTLLCHVGDVPSGMIPGDNNIEGTTDEGYDEVAHVRVYELDCSTSPNFDTTMTSPGIPTCNYTLPSPTITPNDGEVSLVLTNPSSNPYDFAVPSVTTAIWTASVADTSITCEPIITVHPYVCPSTTTTDGYAYPVVGLTYNCWTAENLHAKHYADGATEIPDVMTYATPDYTDVEGIFGNLYTWDAASNYSNTSATQGICPDGWHLPTQADWQGIINAYPVEGLMSTNLWIPVAGSNSTLFNAVPSGQFNAGHNAYEDLNVMAYFWTASQDGSKSVACEIGAACGTSTFFSSDRNYGYSVRCIMDALP